MTPPEAVPSPAGHTIEVAPVADERAGSVLGKLDTITIDSGPDLLTHVEGELVNSLSRMGFAVRQVDRDAPRAGRKQILPSLLSAELSSESTLRFPVAAAVRVRIEVLDEYGQSTFRKEIRGATSRDLGFHTQGGVEDAQVLAEAIGASLSSLAADPSFAVAVGTPPEETANQRASQTPGRTTGSDRGTWSSEEEQSAEGIADRLATLDRLLKEGLIDQHDYEKKRQGILDEL
jgi:hypothetical protein